MKSLARVVETEDGMTEIWNYNTRDRLMILKESRQELKILGVIETDEHKSDDMPDVTDLVEVVNQNERQSLFGKSKEQDDGNRN